MPELENVMYNYTGCTQMMFGKKVKYCVTYKTGEKSFDIYKQKLLHNLRVPISHENLEKAGIIVLHNLKVFFVLDDDFIKTYCGVEL